MLVSRTGFILSGTITKTSARLAYVSKCISKADCLTFLYQDGKFAFLPVGQ